MMTGTPMNSKAIMLMLVGPAFAGEAAAFVEPVIAIGPPSREEGKGRPRSQGAPERAATAERPRVRSRA